MIVVLNNSESTWTELYITGKSASERKQGRPIRDFQLQDATISGILKETGAKGIAVQISTEFDHPNRPFREAVEEVIGLLGCDPLEAADVAFRMYQIMRRKEKRPWSDYGPAKNVEVMVEYQGGKRRPCGEGCGRIQERWEALLFWRGVSSWHLGRGLVLVSRSAVSFSGHDEHLAIGEMLANCYPLHAEDFRREAAKKF